MLFDNWAQSGTKTPFRCKQNSALVSVAFTARVMSFCDLCDLLLLLRKYPLFSYLWYRASDFPPVSGQTVYSPMPHFIFAKLLKFIKNESWEPVRKVKDLVSFVLDAPVLVGTSQWARSDNILVNLDPVKATTNHGGQVVNLKRQCV